MTNNCGNSKLSSNQGRGEKQESEVEHNSKQVHVSMMHSRSNEMQYTQQ
jgi:hypothetical protein